MPSIRQQALLLLVLIVLISAGCLGEERVSFSEDVRDDMTLVGEGRRFNPGRFYARLKHEEEFGVEYLEINLYRLEGEDQKLVEERILSVNPKWTMVAQAIELKRPGEYRIEFIGDGELLGAGTVRVVLP